LQEVLRNLHVVPEENKTVWVSTRFPLGSGYCEFTMIIDDKIMKNAQATLFKGGKDENGELALYRRDYSAVMFEDRPLPLSSPLLCPLLPP
jgi:hypothetical protein